MDHNNSELECEKCLEKKHYNYDNKKVKQRKFFKKCEILVYHIIIQCQK
jgi:hypothetical protein